MRLSLLLLLVPATLSGAGSIPYYFEPAADGAYATRASRYSVDLRSTTAVFLAGSPQPLVSTLNAFEGQVLRNAAIVPAGSNGSISAFATDATDLILDINGYFAP